MSNIRLLLRTEWKLLVRGPMLWLMAAAAAGLAWLVYTIERYGTNVLVFPQKYGFLYTGPLTIGALLAGVYGAKRDKVLKTERILGALPYRSGRLQTVRLAVAAIPYVFLNLLPAGLLVYQWFRQLEAEPDIGGILLVQAVFALGMLYPVALGWLMGMVFPGRLSYFLGFVTWLVHAYGGLMLLNLYLPDSWYALPNFMLFDYSSMGYLDGTWGYLTDSTFWLHRTVYFGLTALLLLFIVGMGARKRLEPVSKLLLRASAGIAAVIVLVSAVFYVGIRSDRIEAYHQWEQQAEAQLGFAEAYAKAANEGKAFVVSSYKMNVTQSGSSKLAVDAVLELSGKESGPLQELNFTLHPNFGVTAVKLNGTEMPYEKDGYRLTVRPTAPIASVEGASLELSYEGRLEEWKLIRPYGGGTSGNKLERSYRVSGDEWYLPGVAGWYPLPGLHALAQPNKANIGKYSEWVEAYPVLDKARFEVKVAHRPGLKLFSNASVKTGTELEGTQETVVTGTERGLSLVAGALQEIAPDDESPVRMVASIYQNADHVKSFLSVAGKDMSEINRILGLPEASRLTLLPVDSSTDRGEKDVGGLITLDGGVIDYSKGQSVFIQQYFQMTAGPVTKNGAWNLNYALLGYLESEGLTKPVRLGTDILLIAAPGSGLPESLKRIEDYMNSHSKEEVERMLQNMYEAVKTEPDQPLPLDKLLQ